MDNLIIKQKIKESRLFNYEIAEAIGISENTLSRWFRKPLTHEQRVAIVEAIDKLKGGEVNAG